MRRPFLPFLLFSALCLAPVLCTGCFWLLVGGAAGEGGYVAAKKQPARQTLRDQRITSSVKTKLIANGDVAARNINVDTEGGVVTLRGTVRSSREAAIAVKVARTTKGVKKVVSLLEVLP